MNAEELASTLAVLAAALGPRHAEAVQELAYSLRRSGDPSAPVAPLVADLLQAAETDGALEVEKDHVRLFLSPRGALCPPWEGAWFGETPRLFGPCHESVLAFARRLKVEPQNYERESADHVATELTLAGFLLSTENHGLFQEFWEAHLRKWLSTFGRCLEEHATTEFYRLVGRALQKLAAATMAPVSSSPNFS